MNLQNFYNELVNNNGASYSIVNGILNPNSGYFVSLPNREQQINRNDFNTSILADFINNNSDLLSNENNFVGGWIENGIVYLDVSEQIADKRTALNLGVQRNQLAIYDANNGNVISLPSPQRSGTATQQKAYLTQAIDNLM
jgi:hypothetical protein